MENQATIFMKKSFVVITSASKGIGRCITLQFGAKFPYNSVFVLMARNLEALKMVRIELMTFCPKTTVLLRQYDQGNIDNGYFDGIFSNILSENKLSTSEFDQALLVHNCASIGEIDKSALQLCEAKHVRSFFDINLTGMILLNTSFFTAFSNPAISRIVVNITSGASEVPIPSLHQYCAGKVSRDMFFRVLAAEEPSIRILTFAPGAVDTEMLQEMEGKTSSLTFRKTIQDLRQANKLWTSEEAVSNLVQILEENTFDNAVNVNKYDQLMNPIVKDM